MKQWITFDLDGTLMLNPFLYGVFPEVERLILEEMDQKIDVRGLLFKEHQRRLELNMTIPAYDWDDIVNQTIKKLGLSLHVNVEDLVKKYCYVPVIRLLDDTIISTLEQLRTRGYSLAAVTNGFYKFQYPVMEALGFASCFEEVITPDNCGYRKPDIRMFEPLTKTGEIAAHVGDRLEHDVLFANEFGTISIFIHRKLTDALLALPPGQRAGHPEFAAIYEERLRVEAIEPDQLASPALLHPNHVIGETAELLEILVG